MPATGTDTMTTDVTRKIILGKITGVSGVKGWVKVHSDTVPRNNIVSYKSWDIRSESRSPVSAGASSEASPGMQGNDWLTVTLEAGREQGKTVVAKLLGYNDREAAAKLIGYTVAVERSQLPALAEDEFYWADLIGFDVLDASGKSLGFVQRLFATGANDVMVVEGDAEILIPWIRGSVIVSIDMIATTIHVDWDPDY